MDTDSSKSLTKSGLKTIRITNKKVNQYALQKLRLGKSRRTNNM